MDPWSAEENLSEGIWAWADRGRPGGVFIGRDQGVRLECEHPDFLVQMGPGAGMIKGIFVAKTLALRYSVS